MAQDGLKQGKKHSYPNKSTNIIGVSDVEFCVESNGIKKKFQKWPKMG